MLYRRNDSFTARTVAGCTLLVPADGGDSVYTLNKTGAHLWELAAQPVSAARLVAELRRSYGVDEATAHRDVEKFIAETERLRLITAQPAGIHALATAQALNIAAVRVALAGNCDGSFAPPFAAFLDSAPPTDLHCQFQAAGAEPTLENWPAGAASSPWAFGVDGDEHSVVRHTTEGQALWRMTGNAAFTTVRLSWHPSLFTARYQSCRAAWSTGLGFLALGMRLRTAGGVMLHGAAAELEGCGLLCCGVSGTGKSTIARLLHDAGATLLTDERAVIRRTGDTFHLYGTPWPSSAGFALNRRAPLRRVYFLRHGAVNRITPLTAAQAIRRLIPVSMISWLTPALLDPWLATLEALVSAIPCAQLEFLPTAHVVDMLRE